MNLLKKGYNYGYSFIRISYIFILRIFNKDYVENRKSLKDNNENYIENFNALFGCCTYIIDNIFLAEVFFLS